MIEVIKPEKIESANPFNAEAWRNLYGPWRPSFSDKMIYRDLVRGYTKKTSALILGATPELRDILFEKGIKNRFVVDINSETVAEMGLLRKYSADDGEEILIGNWLDLPFGGLRKESVDIIMADLPFWVLQSLEDHHLLMESCARIIKPKGALIMRIHFLNETSRFVLLEALLAWVHRQGIEKYKIDSPEELISFLSSVLVDYCTDAPSYEFNRGKCREMLFNLSQRGWYNKLRLYSWPKSFRGIARGLFRSFEVEHHLLPTFLFDHLLEYWINSVAVGFVPTSEFFAEFLTKKFTIRRTFFHYDLPVSPYYPILWLEKR